MPNDTTNNVDTEPSKIEFVQFHQPVLKDGDYTITVEQSVQITQDSGITSKAFESHSHFYVAGERFSFNPSLIYSVFPPEGSLGEHSNVLPHVILNRSTLPWERMADADSEETPWLALLLFDADDAVNTKIMKLSELKEKKEKPEDDIKWIGVDFLETGQDANEKVSVIEVQREILENILPSADELLWLSHVRQGKNDKDEVVGDELAVIIGNRLPLKEGISTAHLVSVEGRYSNGVFNYQKAEPQDFIRFVSLKSWSFACVDKHQSFKGLLENLDPFFKRVLEDKKPYPIEGGDKPERSGLRLPPQMNTSPEAEKYLSMGSVPLPHFMREGSKTISWYHGPLIPGENTTSRLPSPVRAADELLRYNASDGMFDVSYAAAWELGRLLALQSKKISVSLYHWKRAHVQQQKQAEQQLLHAHLPELGQTLATVEIPEDITAWFGDLSLLQGVPFNYLVPDERMLPKESIRFFRLDPLWVDCLLDGAFSIGRVMPSDHEHDQNFAGNLNEKIKRTTIIYGCLLRSEVISGWTDLLVDAYDKPYDSDDAEAGNRLKLLRMDRLSPNILLCVFSGEEMKRVEVHQKPESLHFGFVRQEVEPNTSPPTYIFTKTLRNEDGTEDEGNSIEIDKDNLWKQKQRRVVNIDSLAKAILPKLTPPPEHFTSAQFALQMIEGVEKVIFQV
jgi:hypothetical protein